MRQFLQKISVFLTLGLCLNLLSYYGISKPILDDPYFENIQSLENADYSTIILGDSHAERVKQKYLNDHILNLGYDSDSFGDMYLKLSFILKQDLKPSTILIPADYHLFSSYRTSNDNRRRSIRFSDREDFNFVQQPLNSWQFLLQKYIHPYLPLCNSQNNKLIVLASITKIKLLISRNTKVVDDRKWSEIDESDKISSRQSRFNKHFLTEESEKEKTNLMKIVKLCNSHKVNISALRWPLDSSYNNLIPSSHKAYIDSIFTALNLKIDDQSFRYKQDSFFADQDHLSVLGAEDFGRYITNTYNIPITH